MSYPSDDFERIRDEVKNGAYHELTEEEQAKAAETALVDELIEVIDAAQSDENEARLNQGEAAALLHQSFGWGGLKEAASRTRVEYKTLAERARVVEYYSAGQNIAVGDSVARELLAEYPTLTWTHLRVAKGMSKNRGIAIAQLQLAVQKAMSPSEFKKHAAEWRQMNGHPFDKIVIDGRAGYRLTITRK